MSVVFVLFCVLIYNMCLYACDCVCFFMCKYAYMYVYVYDFEYLWIVYISL